MCNLCPVQAVPNATNKLSEADVDALTKRTQDGGTEVVQAKAGKVGAGGLALGLRPPCCHRVELVW
jgi:malate/lactate dehydrogenase